MLPSIVALISFSLFSLATAARNPDTATSLCVRNPLSRSMCTLIYATISNTPTSNLTAFNHHCRAVTTPTTFTALKNDVLKGYFPIPTTLNSQLYFYVNATVLPSGVYDDESFLWRYGDEYGDGTTKALSQFPEYWISSTTTLDGGVLSFFHRIPFPC